MTTVIQPDARPRLLWRYWTASPRRQLTAFASLLLMVTLLALVVSVVFAAFTTRRSANQAVVGGSLSLTSGYATINTTLAGMLPGDTGSGVWEVLNIGTLDTDTLRLAAPLSSYTDSVSPSSTSTEFAQNVSVTITWCTAGWNPATGACTTWSATPAFSGTLDDLQTSQELNLPEGTLAATRGSNASPLPLRISYVFSVDAPQKLEGASASVTWTFEATQRQSLNNL